MECMIEDYQVEIGVHCALSSVVNAIKNINPLINESVVFFLENGFETKYSINDMTSIRDILLSNFLEVKVESFLQGYKIEYAQRCYEKDIEYLKGDIEKTIKKGIPFIVSVDTRFLEHSSIYKKNISRRHVITIIGCNDEGYIISDCYVPTSPVSTYQGIMTDLALHNAWQSTGKTFFEINFDKICDTQFEMSYPHILMSVKKNLIDYICCQKDNEKISDLKRFAKDISRLTEFFGIDEIKNNIWELSFKIQFDSIIPSRRLLKKVLIELITNGKTNLDERHIIEIDSILDMWKKITYMIIRAGFSIRSDYFKKISELILVMIDIEVELFERICKEI